MNIVYLLDPATQKSYAIDVYESSFDALNRKDRLNSRYKNNIFYYKANAPEPDQFYSLEEALLLVNGEDIH